MRAALERTFHERVIRPVDWSFTLPDERVVEERQSSILDYTSYYWGEGLRGGKRGHRRAEGNA